jgi:hypothetical protein
MPEYKAANSYEWKRTYERSVPISRYEVDALVPEHALDEGAPSQLMEVGEPFLPRNEAVPFFFGAAESFDLEVHATPTV